MTVQTSGTVGDRLDRVENTPVAPAPVQRPVNSWGLTHRIMIVAAVLIFAAQVWVAATNPQDGIVELGEGGRSIVPIIVGGLAALLGGGIAGIVGSFIVTLMGGKGRSAARYVVGGLVGGIVSVVVVILVFANTVAVGPSFWTVLLGLPVAGLLGGIWAGVSAARR